MAVEIRLLTKNQPKILDLVAGKVRKTVYAEASPALGPLALITIGAVGAALAPGVGRFLFGPAASNEGKEKLAGDLLLAKLHKAEAEVDRINAQTAKLAKDFSPLIQEEQRLKNRALEDSIPLDLARKANLLEAEIEARERADRDFPIIQRAREAALQIQEDLARDRREAHLEALQLSELAQERAAAETERVRAATEQQEVNTRLIETAIDGMDFFSKQIFLRDRLFPPRAEAAPLSRVTTIRAF